MNGNIFSSKNFEKAVLVVLGMLAIFLLAKTVGEFKQYSAIDNQNQNVISVNGTGEVYAKADIAEISFTVDEVEKTVALAQQKATDKNNNVIDFLKKSGVEDKDIKTTGYNINPKYDYSVVPCAETMKAPSVQSQSYPSTAIACPPSSKNILVGYEVSESVDVKLRDISKAGDILAGIGKLSVSNVSGLSFTIDNQDTLKAEARKMAIDDAKAKAEKIADDLGISLGKISSFYENGDVPMYSDAKGMAVGGGLAPVSSPQISTGQNKITVNVSVTYKLD